MTRQVKMYDFVSSRCTVMEDKSRFVDCWLATKGNPCLACDVDKSNCSFYKELTDKGALGKEERIERRARDRN